jgi:peptidoglycan/xylan/chitin deacetylase (PgdA/CDA1 family)
MSGSAPVALTALSATSVGMACFAMAWAVRGRSASVFAPSVWRGSTNRPSLALTFDDGPTPSTPEILDILREYRVPATFFQVGNHVSAYPEIAREVHAQGHEIGNHSQTHPNLALARPKTIAAEFGQAQESIIAATGHTPAFLRAPYGVRWFGFRAVQQRLKLTGAMWTVIGLDWKLSPEAISNRILTRAAKGDIICLHDGRGTLKDPDISSTVEAVRRIVPNLLEKGYHFETVTQLLCPMK